MSAALTDLPGLRRERWSRLTARAPLLVSAVLAALLLAELARIVLAVRAPTRPIPVAAAARGRPAPDVPSIVAAHLFGAAPIEADPDHAPRTTADLKLSGTIATEQPKHGFAIIVGGGGSHFYAVGDSVGGAALFAVYLDRVILDRAGTLETLLLPHTALATLQGLAHAAVAGAKLASGPFLDNLGRVVDRDPGVLDRIMRTIDTYDDKAGKLKGFRVYPVASGVALRVLGLSPGDVLTTLNGTAFENLQQGRELLRTLSPTTAATATVERQGQMLSVTLNVPDAAAELRSEAAVKGGAAAAEADRS